jgi:hypothetical protein
MMRSALSAASALSSDFSVHLPQAVVVAPHKETLMTLRMPRTANGLGFLCASAVHY